MNLLLLFLFFQTAKATPIPEIPNATTVCSESTNCFVTSSTGVGTIYQFGAGTTWCQTFTNPTYPLKVSYTNPNTQLCPYDPAPGVVKSLVAGQQATAYTVTTTQNGHTVVVPIPAHVVPPPSTTYPVNCNGSLVVPAGTPSGTTIPLTGVTCWTVTP